MYNLFSKYAFYDFGRNSLLIKRENFYKQY